MNGQQTIESFEEVLLPFLNGSIFERREIVMDGARAHTCKVVKDWIQQSGLRFVEFGGHPCNVLGGYPPNSPDLNPIENIFSIWQNNVQKRKYSTVEEFIDVIQEEWEKIKLLHVRNCIDSTEGCEIYRIS